MGIGPGERPFLPHGRDISRFIFVDNCLASSQRYQLHQKFDATALEAWENRLVMTVITKRLFTTRNGRLGLAHREAGIGDRIAILASGEMPFVLRPVHVEQMQREAFIIIGACYLNGVIEMSDPFTAYTDKKQMSCTARPYTSELHVC